MKKSALIIFLLVVIPSQAMANQANSNEIIDLAEIVMANDMAVETWQVTIKEQMDREKLQAIIHELKNSYLVTSTEDANVIEYNISDSQKKEHLFESYNVIIPKNTRFKAELIVTIGGTFWNKTIQKSYTSRVNAIISDYFTEEAKRFACLTTDSHDTIKSDYFIESVKQATNLKYISTQTDTIEKSMHKKIIYGYTPLWAQKITIKDKPGNLQFVIKSTKNGNVKFTIGTPILINEY